MTLRQASWGGRALIGIALVGTLLFSLNPGSVYDALQALSPNTLGLVLLLGLAGLFVQWIKWQHLLNCHYPQLSRSQGLKSLVVGFGLGCSSPGRLGELGKGLVLQGNRLELVGLSALDRASSAAITIVAAWLGLVVLGASELPPMNSVVVAVVIGVPVAVILVASIFATSARIPTGRIGRWLGLSRLSKLSGLLLKTKRQNRFAILAYSMLFNLIFFVQFFILINDHASIPAMAVWAIPAVFAVKSLLPISFLDLGVREGAAVLVFASFGVDPVVPFNAALVMFSINVLIPGLAGLGLLQWHFSNPRQGAVSEVYQRRDNGRGHAGSFPPLNPVSVDHE